jgi:hypothetical protein
VRIPVIRDAVEKFPADLLAPLEPGSVKQEGNVVENVSADEPPLLIDHEELTLESLLQKYQVKTYGLGNTPATVEGDQLIIIF